MQLTLFRLILASIIALVTLPTHAAGVLIMGDSISAGYGIDPEQGWVALLEKEISPVAVVNASISGETSGGGLARLPKLLERYQPQWLVIELGGNDGLRGYPVASLSTNLAAMVKLGQAANTKVLLLGMQIPPNYGKRYSRLFKSSFSTVAKQTEVDLMPFFIQSVALQGSLMQADGIHPKQEAQALMLADVMPYIHRLMASGKSSSQNPE